MEEAFKTEKTWMCHQGFRSRHLCVLYLNFVQFADVQWHSPEKQKNQKALQCKAFCHKTLPPDPSSDKHLFKSGGGFILELLPRFELGTSSLPTDWEPSSPWFSTLSSPFCSKRMRSAALFALLFPSARFPVWVSVWVKHDSSYCLVNTNIFTIL